MGKKTIVLFLFLLVFCSTLFAQSIFFDQKYGFSVQEPVGWRKELDRNPYFNLDKNGGKNIVTFYKYERGISKEINSTINISVEKFAGNNEQFMKHYLKESNWKETYYLSCDIVKKPETMRISRHTAITGIVHFKYQSHGTPKTTFRKRIYYLLDEKKLFKIVIIDDPNIEADPKLFDDLVKSIKIEQ